MLKLLKKKFKYVATHHRAKTKTVTWRIIASTDTFLLSLGIIHFFPELGVGGIAGAIATAEILNKMFLYWGHEKLWQKVDVVEKPVVSSQKLRNRLLNARMRSR